MKTFYLTSGKIKPLKLMFLLVFVLSMERSKGQVFSPAEAVKEETTLESSEEKIPEKSPEFAPCPPPGNYGNITATPSQPVFCRNNNLQLKFTKTNPNPYSGPLNWNFTGSANSTNPSGPNNTFFNITGFQSSGVATAFGALIIGGVTCTFAVNYGVNLSTLNADAGPDRVYIPCGGPVNIGVPTCALNGNPPYTSRVWSPSTGIVGPLNICQTQVDNLTNNQTYILTVLDQYCTDTDTMNVTLGCPSPGAMVNISINPSQPVYCLGSNISGNVSISNGCFTFVGAASWNYSGSPAPSTSGANNENYSITGLTAGGVLQASGTMQFTGGGSLSCPYTAQNSVNLSNLVADAGPDQVYIPCGGQISIGSPVCALNGNPPFNQMWSPPTGIVGPLNTCITQVDNLTSNQTYTLTVTDQFCTATDEMDVILGCPPATGMANISINPSQVQYCPGDNISGSLNISNACFSLLGGVNWGFAGSPVPTISGANNENYSISGLTAGGFLQANGSMKLNSGNLTCPYTTQTNVSLSNLTANAGNNKVYIVGGGPITIGAIPCQLNGTPPYTSASWLPLTGIVGSPNGCQVQVNNLASSITYTLTITDQYCTASAQMKVIVSTMYCELKRELDSGFHTVNNGNLYFTIDGEYNTMNLDYKIYNYQRTIMTGLTVTPSSLIHDDNRYFINVSILSQGYYVLEVVNQKNEKRVLRFYKV